MDECPWCEKELDLDIIYREYDLNDDGYFECPHCGKQFTIIQEISYTYSAEMGPAPEPAQPAPAQPCPICGNPTEDGYCDRCEKVTALTLTVPLPDDKPEG